MASGVICPERFCAQHNLIAYNRQYEVFKVTHIVELLMAQHREQLILCEVLSSGFHISKDSYSIIVNTVALFLLCCNNRNKVITKQRVVLFCKGSAKQNKRIF